MTKHDSKFKTKDAIDNWILRDLIGSGGQGEVWSVRFHGESHAPVAALKICLADDKQSRDRFRREIEFLSAPQLHNNLVKMRGSGEHAGSPYLVMELASTSLERLVLKADDSAGQRVLAESPALVLKFFKQACDAMAFLHARNILHRDIKPSNILLVLEPKLGPMRAVMADLGIAATMDSQGQLTGAQEFVGTKEFRAPESTNRHTKSSDVYSLGKTLEFLLRRQLPSQDGPVLCSRDPRLSQELWDTLDKILNTACELDPRKRYQDAGKLSEALPELVMTSASISNRASPGSPSTLEDSEILVLAAVFTRCHKDGDGVLLSELEGAAPVSTFAFAMALHELQHYQFVELVERTQRLENDFDYIYTFVRLLQAGVVWARKNKLKMTQLWDAEVARTSDIPF